MRDIFEKMTALGKKEIHDPQWLGAQERILRAHMSLHPLVPRATGWRRLLRPLAASCAGIVLALSGVSAVAAKSLPGDALYGWKLHVNERVESALTFGARNNATLETERLNVRLQELNTVNNIPAVRPEIKVQVHESVVRQHERAEEAIVKLEEQGSVDEAITIQDQLPSIPPVPTPSHGPLPSLLPSLPIKPTMNL